MLGTGSKFDGPSRLASLVRPHRMGPNPSWPSTEGGEVASSFSEKSRVTRSTSSQEASAACSGGHRQSLRTKSSVRGRSCRWGGKACQARGRGSEHPITPSCCSASLTASGTDRCSALRSGHGILVPAPAQGAWMGCGPPRFEDIPPIPTSSAQDLAAWMSQRNCELRNAIEFGDPMLVAKIGGVLGQGASVLSTVGSGLRAKPTFPTTRCDEIRSRGAPGEGRFAPH